MRMEINDLLKKGYAPDGKGGFVLCKNKPNTTEPKKQEMGDLGEQKNENLDGQKSAGTIQSNNQGFPISKAVCLEVKLTITGNPRRDLDNALNGILDCLVKAEVIKDDRIQCVPAILIYFEPGETNSTEIWLYEKKALLSEFLEAILKKWKSSK